MKDALLCAGAAVKYGSIVSMAELAHYFLCDKKKAAYELGIACF
jgi:hypothetical protein